MTRGGARRPTSRSWAPDGPDTYGVRNAPWPRATVTWEGPGAPIMLKLYGPDGEEAVVPLKPVRALTLAQELLTRGVQAIKANQWGPA